jgi:GH24 family phage-related lysozyme (muramidase)
MPIIPEYGEMRRGGYSPAVADAGTAMAPFKARQEIAGAVGEAADAFAAVRERTRRIEDNGSANRAALIWQKAAGEHENFRLANPDEAAWGTDLAAREKAAREEIAKLPMSPEARSEIGLKVDGWSQAARLDVEGKVEIHKRKRAITDYSNLTKGYVQGGNFEEARAATHEAVRMGTLVKEDGDAALMDIDEAEKDWTAKKADEGTRAVITADPRAWLESNAPEKLPEGVDATTYARQQDFARNVLANVTEATTQTIYDGMATGDVKTAEDVDQLGSGLRPAVREHLKEQLYRRAQAMEVAVRKTPEYQNQLVGRASSLINGWNPAREGFDSEMAEIVTAISDIEDAGTKAALSAQWQEIRDGQKRTFDTAAKLADKALEDAFEAGRFGDAKGSGLASMSTQAAVDDGLLTDGEKLARAGFSPEQIKKLQEEANPIKRKQLYREEFGKRTGQDKLTEFERAGYLAVREGKSEFSAVDPEAMDAAVTSRIEAEAKYGAARVALLKFAKAYPNATKEDYEGEILRLAGEDARNSLRSATISARPGAGLEGGPKGAHAGTATVPVGRDLQTMVKHFEAGGEKAGFHAEAYPDGRQWSIGYGTKAVPGETITKEEAQRRLEGELAKHAARVDRIAGYLKLKPHERDALISFDFNTGDLEKLTAKGTRSREEIAEKMLMYRNATMNGKLVRLAGLERRRRAEQYLFLNGYTN